MALPAEMRGAMLLGRERIETVKVPVPRPGRGEILLRIEAATTCGTDLKVFLRGGHPRMLKVPAIFGHEFAGIVAACGEGVKDFAEGDRVVVANSAPCGACLFCRAGRENLCTDLEYLNGGFAEYNLIPPRFVRANAHRIPAGLPAEIAALTEPLACVLHGVEMCELPSKGKDGVEAAVFGAGPIGLLFVASLAREGHRVILADLDEGRLEVGKRLGAARAVRLDGSAGGAEAVRAETEGGLGAQVAIDATGVPQVWKEAMGSVRPGGLVNLFGGCAPGTKVELDTHHIHYGEITVKGVYHHRPATVKRALDLLAAKAFDGSLLLSEECPIEDVEKALRKMAAKKAIKVVVRP